MKKRIVRMCAMVAIVSPILGLLTGVASGAEAAAKDKPVAVELGGGFIISPGYGSLLKDAYPHASSPGIGGWLNLQGGIRFRLSDQFSITPTLGVLLNYVIVSGGGQDENYLNSILVPSLSARYSFSKAPSLYVGGEVNCNSPSSGSDRYDLKSDGIGFGGYVGYAFEGGMNMEVGYLDLPVKTRFSKENLGGVLLRAAFAF